MKDNGYILLFAALFIGYGGCCTNSSFAIQNQTQEDAEKAAYEEFVRCLGRINDPQWEKHKERMREILEANPDFAARENSASLDSVGRQWAWAEYETRTNGKEAIDDQRYCDILKYLLDNGASPNGQLLASLAQSSNEKMVAWCLEQGVDVNSTDKYSYTPLHRACENWWLGTEHNFRIVKLLIDGGANVNAMSSDDAKYTPLHFTFDPQIVKLLVEAGADVNVRNGYQMHSLFKAALGGPLETVKILVENGAELNLAQYDGATPLSFSGGNPDLEVFHYLYSQGARYDKVHPIEYAAPHVDSSMLLERLRFFFESEKFSPSDECRKKLFPFAVRREVVVIECLEYLLEMGCDINGAEDYSKRNALYFAINRSEPDMELVRFLVEHGIDINSSWSQTALHEAMNKASHDEMIKYLVENGADISIRDYLRYLPFQRQYASLQYLFDLKIDANQRDANGNSLLHHAASSYPVEAVQNLLKNGADPDAKGANGITPLHSLVRGDFTREKLTLLLDAGADPNAKDDDGLMPLWDMVCIQNLTLEEMKQFAQKGFDFTVKDKNGQTLLFRIAQKPAYPFVNEPHLQIVSFILEQGVDINACDNEGRTAIFYAAGLEAPERYVPCVPLFQYLAGHGAKLDIVDSQGRAPLFAAACGNHSGAAAAIAKYLIEEGQLDINAKDKQGMTPLMVAVIHSDPNELEKMRGSSLPARMHIDNALIRYLLSKNCDVNATDNEGQTALDKAVAAKNARLALLLLEHGARSGNE